MDPALKSKVQEVEGLLKKLDAFVKELREECALGQTLTNDDQQDGLLEKWTVLCHKGEAHDDGFKLMKKRVNALLA